MSEVYKSIMAGLGEAREHAEGKRTLNSNTLFLKPIPDYRAEEIKQIRNDLGMTQVIFASFMGVSKKTVEAWEAGRNKPDGPARRILSMVQMDSTIPERFNIVTR